MLELQKQKLDKNKHILHVCSKELCIDKKLIRHTCVGEIFLLT